MGTKGAQPGHFHAAHSIDSTLSDETEMQVDLQHYHSWIRVPKKLSDGSYLALPFGLVAPAAHPIDLLVG